jgi:hypothetical protein
MADDDNAERWRDGGSSREERRTLPEARRAHKSRQDQLRRDRIKANGPVESFTPQEIGQRDGWLCGICQDTGHPVDPGQKRPHPLSPALDHIKPVADGGTHTRDNVCIAHWFCNHEKNDSPSMRTIGGPGVERSRCWLGRVLVFGWVRWCAVVLLYLFAVRRCPFDALNCQLGKQTDYGRQGC